MFKLKTVFGAALAACCFMACQKASAPVSIPSVTSEGITPTSITVKWTAVENATAYLYKWNDGDQTQTKDLSITFTDLTAETEYKFAIKAISEKSGYTDSQWKEYKFSTAKKGTAAVPAVTAESIGSHEISLKWDAAEGAAFYMYKWNGAEEIQTNELELSFDKLTSNTEYTFAIKSVAKQAEYVDSEWKEYKFKTETEDTDLQMSLVSASFEGITVAFTCGEDVAAVKYGVGRQLTKDADLAAFISGELSTKVIKPEALGFTVTPAAGEPVVIFAQAIGQDSTSEVVELNACPAPISFKFFNVCLGSCIASIEEGYDESKYAGIGILPMTADAPAEWGYSSAEELIQTFAEWGMLDVHPGGDDVLVEFNGEPEVDHIIGVVFFNADYGVDAIKVINFKTGKIIPDAPEATINVTATDITEKSANLNFEPGENTMGYFYTLYKLADFNEMLEYGKSHGYENPEDYVREVVSAYGSMDYKKQTDSRDGLASGTDFILVCYPYNVNGTQGYGPTVHVEFKTLGQAPAQSSAVKASNAKADQKNLKLRKLLKKTNK